jgi:hypothetical protein
MRVTSNRELARQLGVSETAVRRAEKAGRIHREADGSWGLASVKALWARNTDRAQQRRQHGAMKPVPEAAVGAVRETLCEHGEPVSAGPGQAMTFMQARTANEVLKAQERRVRLQRMKGELVDRAYFIGHHGSGRRRRSVCLARLLRDDTVLDLVSTFRGRIGTGSLLLLTSRLVDLRHRTAQHLAGDHALVVPLLDGLDPNAPHPFALRTAALAGVASAARSDARLQIDAAGWRATLDGREIPLGRQEFAILSALAEEAISTRTGTLVGPICCGSSRHTATTPRRIRPHRRISTMRSADCAAPSPMQLVFQPQR